MTSLIYVWLIGSSTGLLTYLDGVRLKFKGSEMGAKRAGLIATIGAFGGILGVHYIQWSLKRLRVRKSEALQKGGTDCVPKRLYELEGVACGCGAMARILMDPESMPSITVSVFRLLLPPMTCTHLLAFQERTVVYHVFSGNGTCVQGDETHSIRAGETQVAWPGVVSYLVNDAWSGMNLEVLCTCEPALPRTSLKNMCEQYYATSSPVYSGVRAAVRGTGRVAAWITAKTGTMWSST